jgi:hypothetical protein
MPREARSEGDRAGRLPAGMGVRRAWAVQRAPRDRVVQRAPRDRAVQRALPLAVDREECRAQAAPGVPRGAEGRPVPLVGAVPVVRPVGAVQVVVRPVGAAPVVRPVGAALAVRPAAAGQRARADQGGTEAARAARAAPVVRRALRGTEARAARGAPGVTGAQVARGVFRAEEERAVPAVRDPRRTSFRNAGSTSERSTPSPRAPGAR